MASVIRPRNTTRFLDTAGRGANHGRHVSKRSPQRCLGCQVRSDPLVIRCPWKPRGGFEKRHAWMQSSSSLYLKSLPGVTERHKYTDGGNMAGGHSINATRVLHTTRSTNSKKTNMKEQREATKIGWPICSLVATGFPSFRHLRNTLRTSKRTTPPGAASLSNRNGSIRSGGEGSGVERREGFVILGRAFPLPALCPDSAGDLLSTSLPWTLLLV
ncbi:hypothetical protein B0T24DRAFT_63896 [Lasiosphaeria ovina]|uniref:Uncharacterized protein n=1 Tax=Lasiosphaeria ovina TaxID=92902 RepID=A0AAE0NLN3_9PEZI|nr:hypothetical protein B0T24DRAFT_63896 [Lasiosphaeria ovina]